MNYWGLIPKNLVAANSSPKNVVQDDAEDQQCDADRGWLLINREVVAHDFWRE
jgi:hypothetical protein